LVFLLDSLPTSIALLSKSGVIEFVNKAWKRFAQENFGDESKVGVGVNYFDVCKKSEKEGLEALIGIKSVIEGATNLFSLEYPCHSGHEERWFIVNATPINDRLGGVVVSHINRTQQKLAEKELRKISIVLEKRLISKNTTNKDK
jgi:hypothetical protein